MQQVRNGVEQRKRQNGQQRAPRHPFQLLAQQRRIGAAVTVQEQKRRCHVEDRIVGRRELVEPVEQYLGGLARGDRPDPQRKQAGARRINRGSQPAAALALQPLLRKAEREMQEQSRLQSLGGNVRPEDGPVQSVEGAGVLQRIERERDQAEKIKVRGARCAPAPEKYVKTDDEVDKSDDAQAKLQAAVRGNGNHLDGCVERCAVARDAVENLDIRAGTP